MVKVINVFLEPQIDYNNVEVNDAAYFTVYQASPEYLGLYNRYFLDIKAAMNGYVTTLITGTKNVFDELMASLATYLFGFGLSVAALYGIV